MIHRTEVDGIPAVVAPMSGPTQAGLIFRVGRADETLATTGITHLVEHLALHRHGLTDYHFNGATEAIFTHFHVQGSEADIVAYLHGVCESLTSLPLDRLETEKSILRTEASARGRGYDRSMPLWRYGAEGYGLVSYPEWGLLRLSEMDVEHWVRTWFTRDNAVLWVAGDKIPAGLRLNLAGGRRMPAPAVTSALPLTPAFFRGSDGGVVFDTVVKRSAAAQMFAEVLERELFRSLRQEGGYSYTAATQYEPRGDGFVTISAVADALPDKQDAVVGGFLDVLAKLKAGRIDPADITAVKAKATEGLKHPDLHAMMLPGYAMNVLTAQPIRDLEQIRAEMAAVDVAAVHQVALDAMQAALVQVPGGHQIDWAGYEPAPTFSESAVAGPRFQSLHDNDSGLVIGAEGVSHVGLNGAVTVRYAECAAKLDWPDGARRLIGKDGMVVHVEPTLYRMDRSALQLLDTAVDASRVVQLPPRDPDDIPKPNPPAAAAKSSPARIGAFETIGTVLLCLVTVFMICIGGLTTAGVSSDPETASDGAVWGIVAIVWIGALSLLVPTFLLVRRRVRYNRARATAHA